MESHSAVASRMAPEEWPGVEKGAPEASLRNEGVTKEWARERTYRAVYHRARGRARAIGEEWRGPRRPRPFSISLLRHSSTAAFNDRAGHPLRPASFSLSRMSI